MELNTSINFFSVLVAAIVSFIFGWLWYGPLFGSVWKRENRADAKKGAHMGVSLLKHFVLVFVTVMAVELLFVGSFASGIALVLVLWLGFIVTNRLSSLIWMEGSTISAMIDIVYHLANLIIIVVVLNVV